VRPLRQSFSFNPTWPTVVCQQSFFTHLAKPERAGRLHGRGPLPGRLAQRLPAELADARHDRVLHFVAGVERARAVLHLINWRRHGCV